MNIKKHLLLGLSILVCVGGCCSGTKMNSSTQKEQTAKLVRLGKAQYESGELDAAANTLLDCLRADPQNAPAQYYLNLVREAELLKSLKQKDIGGDFWYPTIPPRRIR